MVVHQGASVDVHVRTLELLAQTADSAGRGEDAPDVLFGEELRG